MNAEDLDCPGRDVFPDGIVTEISRNWYSAPFEETLIW